MNKYEMNTFNLRFKDPQIESEFLIHAYDFSIWQARTALMGGLFFLVVGLGFLFTFELGTSNLEFILAVSAFTIFFILLWIITFTSYVTPANLEIWVSAVLVSIFVGAALASLYVNYNPQALATDKREELVDQLLLPSLVAGLIYINTLGIVRFSSILVVNAAYHLTATFFSFFLVGVSNTYLPIGHQALFLAIVSIPSIIISYSRERGMRLQFESKKNLDLAKKESELAKKETEQMLHLFKHLNINTQTPNRAQLQECLSTYFQHQEKRASLILLKLARFKEINNTIGHERCDELLRLITLRIDAEISLSKYEVLTIGNNLQKLPCNIAVIEGISFAIVLKEDREAKVKEFAAYLRDSTSGIVELEGTLLDLQMLVGVSACAFSEHEKSPQEIIHEAQVGLAIAATRESRIGVYSPGLDSYSEQKLSLMGNLRRAIIENSLELHYQPKIDFSRKEIYGVEALLRWQNDEGGYYNPFEIITHAESTGVIKDLTRWIINEVFSKVDSLQDVVPGLVVSINVSVLNLREDDFVDFVMNKLVEHKIKAEDIIFEITENNMIENAEVEINRLVALRSCGFKISVDDYGTGYSSLSYLKEMPVNEVKIDRAFITNIIDDESSQTIVEATVKMCHKLGFKVVVEGVENIETVELLHKMSCDLFQGYVFSKPIPLDSIPEFKQRFYRER